MILEKAYYQQNFQTGAFLFAHYGLGALIEPGETHQEVYAQLKERVYSQFRADNPHLEESQGNIPKLDFKFKDGKLIAEDNNDYGPTDIGVYENYVAATTIEPEKPQPKQTIEQATIAQINEVTDKTVLESFLLITKKYPAIKEAYDKRLNEITTKK